MKIKMITDNVPKCLVWNGKTGIKKGTKVKVIKTFLRNGEGWCRLEDGREIPDVFVSL